MEQLLKRYFEGRISENEFEELFDYIKNNGVEWMEPTLRNQWEEIEGDKIIPLLNKEGLFKDIQAATKKRKKIPLYLYRIAATLLIFGIVSIMLFLTLDREDSNEYTFNTVQPIKLPDGSLVLLKENSTLRFIDWQNNAPREVWLEGSAFFSVEKPPERSNPKFIVHTVNFDVQVLGTKFSIEASKLNTKVALKTGKIRLVKDETIVDMIPGELVVYEPKSRVFNIQEINTDTYLPLEEKIVSFENEPLSEVMKKIKQSFGVNIILLDHSLRNERFTGEANGDDMASFYIVLEEAFGVLVKKHQNGNVEISKKKNED